MVRKAAVRAVEGHDIRIESGGGQDNGGERQRLFVPGHGRPAAGGISYRGKIGTAHGQTGGPCRCLSGICPAEEGEKGKNFARYVMFLRKQSDKYDTERFRIAMRSSLRGGFRRLLIC